ncbi:MAG: hypothetical protein LQ342_006768 [Letrouitia transgressa]|nr:MAG: hypothetical protein LQ342_006768 [Letrouitia transgressa]
MPPSKKRKIEITPQNPAEKPPKVDSPDPSQPMDEETEEQTSPNNAPEPTSNTTPDAINRNQERQEKFKALKRRAKYSAEKNLKETAAESHRLATDPNLLTSLNRKRDIAAHKLLKADTEDAGDDFERKRAWDWTIDESEKWDKRMAKKEKHRQDVAFQDYRQDARKIYKRQIREMKPDMDGYERQKAEAIQRAAMSGGLEMVETDDGELAAVDKFGTFYTTADSTDFIDNKPDRAAVDRLVSDLRKAEETRLRKRRDRGKGEEEGDITYINDKNKQFNQKLARFYNKYTAEIRDSFERGTMI